MTGRVLVWQIWRCGSALLQVLRLPCHRYALSDFQSGTVVSASLFGALGGSALAFLVGDKLGRKRELLLAALLYGAPMPSQPPQAWTVQGQAPVWQHWSDLQWLGTGARHLLARHASAELFCPSTEAHIGHSLCHAQAWAQLPRRLRLDLASCWRGASCTAWALALPCTQRLPILLRRRLPPSAVSSSGELCHAACTCAAHRMGLCHASMCALVHRSIQHLLAQACPAHC